MRGLTPEEHAALRYAAGSEREEFYAGSPKFLAMLDLLEQGRVVPVSEPDGWVRWDATPAGREALRLYPLMRPPEAP